MELDEALRQIADIRRQMARADTFRGYRSLTVALSGVAGLAAAVVQPCVTALPQSEPGRYLGLWVGVAAASLGVAGAELGWRARRGGSRLVLEHTLFAVEQFLPCVVVGALLTLCVFCAAPGVLWMLPGLWAMVYALGIFASWRLLPRPVFWVGAYYTLCGCGCLLWGRGEHALSPWLMGVTFGGGQLLGAAVLYWTLERPHAAATDE